MKHRVSLKKLGKTPAHRKAMIRNMLVALFREQRIKTTFAKAKVLRRFAERLITRARKDGVHNRRMARKWIQDKAVLNTLFTEIGPQYVQRPGGYTRIVKMGPRYGDASEMAYIALVVDEAQPQANEQKKTKKHAKPSKSQNITTSEEELKHTETKISEESDGKELDAKEDKPQKADEQNEQRGYHEQRNKKTSKTIHSHVATQKTNVPNTVQQKSQRYRSDKSK